MAIRIEAQLAKKLPIPGSDYSSRQASITITAEVTDPSAVVAEAARLYALCEAAVDAQLGLDVPPGQGTTPPSRTNPPARANLPPPSSWQPAARRPSQARRPTNATASQLKLLGHLLQGRDGQLSAILAHYQVGGLDQLTVQEASALIDSLKEGAPR